MVMPIINKTKASEPSQSTCSIRFPTRPTSLVKTNQATGTRAVGGEHANLYNKTLQAIDRGAIQTSNKKMVRKVSRNSTTRPGVASQQSAHRQLAQ
jgi:hypothetical protein